MQRLLFLICFLPFYLFGGLIVQTDINEPITPATALHVKNTLDFALQKNAKLVLFHLDTPGGLLSSTQEITRMIADSFIPVAIYINPAGAHGASAGTFILYSAHIAAMSPGTNVGAAIPVSLMNNENNQSSSMQTKITQDLSASMRSLANLHDRNATWVELAITKGKSISANEALELNVIDIIAKNTDDLLKQIHGRKVKIKGGEIHTILLHPIHITSFVADTKTKLLRIIANPNIAYIFVMLALYGIFFELMNPGSIFPGVLGGISGLIALYSLNILPFNQAGLLLLILGALLMVAEVFIAGFGILGLGGAVSFVIGSVMLFDYEVLGQDIAWPLILVTLAASLLFFIIVIGFIVRSRKAKSTVGKDAFVGKDVKVISSLNGEYKVEFEGEIWNATSKTPLNVGDYATIEAVEGLHLHLIPKEK